MAGCCIHLAQGVEVGLSESHGLCESVCVFGVKGLGYRPVKECPLTPLAGHKILYCGLRV